MKQKLVEFFATGFYVGRIKPAPGTWGTLVGIPVVMLFKMGPPVFYFLFSVILIFFAVWIADQYEKIFGGHDSSEIVIDEIIGYVVAMTWLPATWQAYLAAFLMFRLFDIWKPGPIRKMDEKIPGGLGTVVDDVAAGLIANALLQIVFVQTNWLGEMWNGHSIG